MKLNAIGTIDAMVDQGEYSRNPDKKPVTSDVEPYTVYRTFLDFKVHAKRFFTMEDFKPLEQKDAMQARIFFMGQLVCSAPRMQGMLVAGPAGY